MSKFKEIWEKLSSIDVADRIEKKNGFNYLSWAWAWGVLMEHYPDSTYEMSSEFEPNSKTTMVFCSIKIDESERQMWLPVMDFRNKAIVNATSRDVSDSMMRCLVKCLAMFGLGHYIYAGEDLPNDSSQPEGFIGGERLEKINELFEKLPADRQQGFLDHFEVTGTGKILHSQFNSVFGMLKGAVNGAAS